MSDKNTIDEELQNLVFKLQELEDLRTSERNIFKQTGDDEIFDNICSLNRIITAHKKLIVKAEARKRYHENK